jgi:GcrA cell cycle regulator
MASWNQKRVERLKRLHQEGFSATLIARKLGAAFTKGMVAGKIRRLGLTMKPAKKGLNSKPKSLATGKALPISKAEPSKTVRLPASPIIGPVPAAPATATGVGLFDLRERHCRWPVGNDRPARLFCGAPVVDSSSWCEHHQRIAFANIGKPAVRERARGSV